MSPRSYVVTGASTGDERPRDSISAGGRPLSQNIYKVTISVMVGFMDSERIEGMVAGRRMVFPGLAQNAVAQAGRLVPRSLLLPAWTRIAERTLDR